MAYTVITQGVCKSFGNEVVLDHVDLALETGSVMALLGPNGAGKTTMVRILATLIRPDAGTATIAGHDLISDPVGVKRSISLTGQYAAVDEVLTGQENLEMMGQLLRLSRREACARARELLSEFDLIDARDRRVKTYSGGMRRRLDLAISMIKRPQLLFLDEPTTGLDPRSRDQLWGTVRRLVDDGLTHPPPIGGDGPMTLTYALKDSPRGGHRHRVVRLPPRPLQCGRITPVPTPHSRLNDSRSRRSL